jgi:hypothetical protein
MTAYLAAFEQYRLVAGRRRGYVERVTLFSDQGSHRGADLPHAMDGYEFAVVEHTSAGGEFFLIDLDDFWFGPNGTEMVPKIVERLADRDSALMALRMVG